MSHHESTPKEQEQDTVLGALILLVAFLIFVAIVASVTKW